MKKIIISLGLIFGIMLVTRSPLPMIAVADAKSGASKMRSYKMLHLSKDAEKLLEKNAFVVVRTKAYRDMDDAYEAFHRDNLPIFLTTDSVLHTTHVLFDFLLRTTEVNHLVIDLNQLTESMLKASILDYNAVEDKEVKEALYSNIAFFSVASRLLNEKEAIPQYVKSVVDEEIRLINNHEGFKKSPVCGYLEDYSQYVPRGHYTRNEDFRSYFLAMMWYGRMGFYVNPNRSLGVPEILTRQFTRQALLIVRALDDAKIANESAFEVWDKIYQTTAFFVGKTDDLDAHDYKKIAFKIYGRLPSVDDLADASKLEMFMKEIRALSKPKILSTLVVDTEAGKKKAEEITLGFRFMGQRFIPDSYVFQKLVYPSTMFYKGNSKPFTLVMSERGPIRGFPRGLDVMAVLGSDHASKIIKEEGDDDYDNYEEQVEKLKKEFALKEDKWTSNLYWNWLYCLKPILAHAGDSVPLFMRSDSWQGKALNAALGSWAELKHDTIIYAKQSVSMKGAGIPLQPQLTHGYVEAYPALYARVRGMIAEIRRGLILRNLVDKRVLDNLSRYERLLVMLETISRKELTGKALSEDEYQTIWNFGSLLRSLTRFPDQIISRINSDIDKRMALIADVHTDPNSGQVLEEADGYPSIVYVKVSVEGKEQIAQGPVFSYYEFKQPISDRLTDEQWQHMLDKGNEPALPRWTRKFMGQQD